MNQTERIRTIYQLLQNDAAVPLKTFLEALEISEASFKRDLTHLRDRMNASIEYVRERQGYVLLETSDSVGPKFSLPGVWFNESEIYALLSMQRLLHDLQPGLLEPQIAPMQRRLEAMLRKSGHTLESIAGRIKLLHAGKRKFNTAHFETVAKAVIAREQLVITHFNKGTNEVTSRTVCPQQLCFYHDNWYLDAWCHLRNAVRSFALDAIQEVRGTGGVARDVPLDELARQLSAGYGIFGGSESVWAKLKFSAQRARWVSNEEWHPEQRSEFLADGSYVLEVPYSDDRELTMEILKHGADVEVLEPETLRTRIRQMLAEAAKKYV